MSTVVVHMLRLRDAEMAGRARETWVTTATLRDSENAQKCRWCRAYLTAGDSLVLDMTCDTCTASLRTVPDIWAGTFVPSEVYVAHEVKSGLDVTDSEWTYLSHFSIAGPCLMCMRVAFLNANGSCLHCTFPESVWYQVGTSTSTGPQ